MSSSDTKTAEKWLPAIYDELRRLAAAKLAQERPGQTLQATALVHEAWLRLGADHQPRWENRAHFFSAAAEAMRRILIDRARKRQVRATSGLASPEELHESQLELNVPEAELLGVHEVLDGLARVAVGDPFVAQDELVVEEFAVDTAGRNFRITQLP